MIMKRFRWALIAVIVVGFVLVGASQYFLYYALSHDTSDYDVEEEFDSLKAEYPWIVSWVDSIRLTDALRDTFINDDGGMRMHAWYIASPDSTDKTAVIMHGYQSNSIDMMQIGYLYNHDLRWNILLPDLLAHGLSDGNTIQMGWNDRHAVAQWIDVAHKLFDADTMVVHGISMGAATTMCVAGDDTPDYVRAFIEDCGYTSVWDEFKGEMKAQFNLPAFPLLHITSALCKLQNGWSFTDANPLEQVKKCVKPMLFIHGDADTYVPTYMVYPLYDAKPSEKQLWLAPGSAHADSYKDHPLEYTATVKKFLQSHQLLDSHK